MRKWEFRIHLCSTLKQAARCYRIEAAETHQTFGIQPYGVRRGRLRSAYRSKRFGFQLNTQAIAQSAARSRNHFKKVRFLSCFTK